MQTIKVKLTFSEGILGTSPANGDVYRDYIGTKSPDAATIDEEVAALGVDAVAEKGRTVFPKLDDGTPFLYDYQIKGFFKDACGMLQKAKSAPDVGVESKKLKAYKKIIDGLIFPQPRKIPFVLDAKIEDCQRPLRAHTAQGERVSLASSDQIPAGATITFDVLCLDDSNIAAVKEWLNYGALRGIGQWRNSGKGRFTWAEITE